MIAVKPVKGFDFKIFKSREEYRNILAKDNLILASDRELIAHFNKNNTQFIKLKNDLIAKGIRKSKSGTNSMKNINESNKLLTALLLNRVAFDSEYSEQNLDFVIGGTTDNLVGYLYVPNKKDLPVMDPSGYIMIKEIGDGWYLYKTT